MPKNTKKGVTLKIADEGLERGVTQTNAIYRSGQGFFFSFWIDA